MEHLKMQTPDIVSDNMAYIAQRWPECLTEAKDENGKLRQVIDFDKLRQALSPDATGEGQERYQFTWPDKRHAIRLANAPTTGTLRPVVENETKPTGKNSSGDKYCSSGSVDFENTQNLYIEGDNLEVLKLLRESYLGKVKMIYIDPPYNTGGDFVYRDNFIKKNSDYADVSGTYDEEGNQIASEFEKNADTNGRFHTDWLNMIYPRLKVARDLLTEDGVIFISIDDNEVHNLRKVCDEVFGERNFVGTITRKQSSGSKNDSGYNKVISTADYLLLYQKGNFSFNPILVKNKKNFSFKDYIGNFSIRALEMQGGGDTLSQRPKMGYSIYYKKETNEVQLLFDYDLSNSPVYEAPNSELLAQGYICYRPRPRGTGDMALGIWRWGDETFKERFAKDGVYFDDQRVYMKERASDTIKKYPEAILDQFLNTRGTNEVKTIFKDRVFSFPKPVSLINYLLRVSSDSDSLILDFFSGSATTAHAVMQLNAEDGGNRKYIMVQLPEMTDEKSEAHKAGYKNICEIGKERIRRAGKKIKEDHPEWKGDTGFRVLKVDTSNMEDVYYTPSKTVMQSLFADNIKADRTDEDLLFQVMMELGIALSEKIERKEIAGKTVWNVKQGYLMACFEPKITETIITSIAKQHPQYFVMADRSLASDNVADNFEQLFEEYSPTTIRKIL